MDKKRVFECRVSMPCTLNQYKKDLREQLVKLGYDSLDKYENLDEGPKKNTMRSLQVNWVSSRASWSYEERFDPDGIFTIGSYNPSLFLALAAMSTGEQFWPGEYAIDTFNDVNLLVVVTDWAGEFKYYVEHESVKYVIHKNHLRRATVEEILNHFQSKEAMQQTEDKVFHLDQKVIYSDRIHTICGYDPKKDACELKDQDGNRFWISTAFIEPLIREKDGSVELPPNTDMYIGDHGTVKPVDGEFKLSLGSELQISSKCLKVGDEIWVWNDNPHNKTRFTKRFAFFTPDNRVAVYYQYNPKHHSMDVQFWSNYAPIDEPVVVSIADGQKHFAKAYGVPAELIKIEG
jgi:hypothetical protein